MLHYRLWKMERVPEPTNARNARDAIQEAEEGCNLGETDIPLLPLEGYGFASTWTAPQSAADFRPPGLQENKPACWRPPDLKRWVAAEAQKANTAPKGVKTGPWGSENILGTTMLCNPSRLNPTLQNLTPQYLILWPWRKKRLERLLTETIMKTSCETTFHQHVLPTEDWFK